MQDSLYQIIKEEYDALKVIRIPNVVERMCASVGAHILNEINMETKRFYDSGLPTNFRTHICYMSPSGFGRSLNMAIFLHPNYGLLSKSSIMTTLSTTFTQESWVGTVIWNESTHNWEATDGVLVRYRQGIVGADEFARLKYMMESRGEEHDVSYLLSALDKDYCEKQHSGKPVTIRDIGMTFWCGLRPVQMSIADSGMARRFSFQTYYPTIKDSKEFKRATRTAKIPISESTRDDIATKIESIKTDLRNIKNFDLNEIYQFIDSDPLIPHFEAQIYTRLALGFGIAAGMYPKIRMCRELSELLKDEKINRQSIRINPEIEMAYQVIIEQNNKANKELIIKFLHYNYQLSKARILSLLATLKQIGRIVESDGYLIPIEKIKHGEIYEIVKNV